VLLSYKRRYISLSIHPETVLFSITKLLTGNSFKSYDTTITCPNPSEPYH